MSTRSGTVQNRAADIGLLTPLSAGYYTIHPALPWYFTTLFTHTYDQPDQPDPLNATHAYTHTYATLGNDYHRIYNSGRPQMIAALAAEEANLLHALHLARTHQNWADAISVAQGLRALYGHYGRASEWARIVNQLTENLIDPTTDQPLPGRDDQYSLITEYRVQLASDGWDLPTATRLQHLRTAWDRREAATALATPPDHLDDTARNTIRTLGVSLHELGDILREQGDPSCVDHYQEAVDLFRRIGARREEAMAEFNVGNAYLYIPALRDLDHAQRSYQRSLDLREDHDHIGLADVTSQLAAVDQMRFHDARDADADEHTLLHHLNNALRGCYQALNLRPKDNVAGLAGSHHQLGAIYAAAGDLPTALPCYQQAISYHEASGNTYDAGRIRYHVALMLARAGRTDDALDWAHAALRDYHHVGPGVTEDATQTQQLIELLQQQRPTPHNA